jgi:hypothetical protein
LLGVLFPQLHPELSTSLQELVTELVGPCGYFPLFTRYIGQNAQVKLFAKQCVPNDWPYLTYIDEYYPVDDGTAVMHASVCRGQRDVGGQLGAGEGHEDS